MADEDALHPRSAEEWATWRREREQQREQREQQREQDQPEDGGIGRGAHSLPRTAPSAPRQPGEHDTVRLFSH